MVRERLSSAGIRRRLRALGDPRAAASLQRFFKTAPGQYGARDRFVGVRVPALRRLARECRDAPLSVAKRLLADPMHEARLLALLLLVDQYRRADARERRAIYRLYLAERGRVNNWDLVDASAEHIIGPHLARREPMRVLGRLARSRSVWDRRIAVLATFHYVKQGSFDDTVALAELLLRDQHDLIHKAVGWMLREVGKRDVAVLTAFLDAHAATMPRTMLRYAIERLPAAQRKRYMRVQTGVRRAAVSARA